MNVTVITVVAIAAVAALFMFFIFPRIKNNITNTVNETGSYKVTGTEDGVNIEKDDN